MNELAPPDLKTLLTYSLREKPGSYLIEEIFQRFPTPVDLIDVTEQELLTIEGVGKVRARQILATLKLTQAMQQPTLDKLTIRSPIDAYHYLQSDIAYMQKEHFVCLYLNTKNVVIAKETISIGTLNASLVHPREVFRSAIKRSSASIICAHNHPSGNPEPSPEDIDITKRLLEVGNIVGIEVLDHIIVGHNTYVSLKERGLMT